MMQNVLNTKRKKLGAEGIMKKVSLVMLKNLEKQKV